MIKGVASDLDGTLIDTSRILAIAWHNALNKNGYFVDLDKIYNETRGLQSSDIVKLYTGNDDKELVDKIRADRKSEFLKLLSKDILFPETVDVIRKIRSRGIKFMIATGLGLDLKDYVLSKTGLTDVFLKAFEIANCSPKEGIVIGDSEKDIIPGKTIGAYTVFISRDNLRYENADYNISNLNSLLNIIDSINSKS